MVSNMAHMTNGSVYFFTVSPPFSGPAVPDLAPSLTCRFIPASADCALYVFRVAARGFFSLIQTLAQLHR